MSEADHGEIVTCELDTIVLADEVEDRGEDSEDGFLGGLWWRRGGSDDSGILREYVFSEVVVVNGRVETGLRGG